MPKIIRILNEDIFYSKYIKTYFSNMLCQGIYLDSFKCNSQYLDFYDIQLILSQYIVWS